MCQVGVCFDGSVSLQWAKKPQVNLNSLAFYFALSFSKSRCTHERYTGAQKGSKHVLGHTALLTDLTALLHALLLTLFPKPILKAL